MTDEGALIIAGSGEMDNYDSPEEETQGGEPEEKTLAPWRAFSDTITEIQIEKQVGSIGSFAFAECGSVTKVTFFGSIPAINETAFTDVTSDLYYAGGRLGTLSIPSLGLSVKVVQGTDSAALAKGVGHFEETSIWNGNVCLAAHNRGTNSYFGQIHTLSIGDTITLTTALGTRSYSVTSVAKVSETDREALAASSENRITLYTCVRDQRDLRWCVQAVEVR